MNLIRLFSEEHPVVFVALLFSTILFLPSLIEWLIEWFVEKLHDSWESLRLIFSIFPKDLQYWQPNYIPIKNIDNSHVQEFTIASHNTTPTQREIEVRTTVGKQRKVRVDI